MDQITDSEVYVTYTDYGNAEWVDPLSMQLIDRVAAAQPKSDTKSSSKSSPTDNTSDLASSSSKTSDAKKPQTLSEAGPPLKEGIKLGDNKITNDVTNKINKLMYKTSRFLTDSTRDAKSLHEFGLTSRQKKKLKAEMMEKEKVARFDPQRYLKAMRQKARPEWFDVAKRSGSRVCYTCLCVFII